MADSEVLYILYDTQRIESIYFVLSSCLIKAFLLWLDLRSSESQTYYRFGCRDYLLTYVPTETFPSDVALDGADALAFAPAHDH